MMFKIMNGMTPAITLKGAILYYRSISHDFRELLTAKKKFCVLITVTNLTENLSGSNEAEFTNDNPSV